MPGIRVEVSIGAFEEIVAPLRDAHADEAADLVARWVREPFAQRSDDLFALLLLRMDLLDPADWNDLVSTAVEGLMAGPPLAAQKFQQLLRFMDV